MNIYTNRYIEQQFEVTNVSSQDLVQAATDAGVSEPMPRDGEAHEDWVERILSEESVLAKLTEALTLVNDSVTDELDGWDMEE